MPFPLGTSPPSKPCRTEIHDLIVQGRRDGVEATDLVGELESLTATSSRESYKGRIREVSPRKSGTHKR